MKLVLFMMCSLLMFWSVGGCDQHDEWHTHPTAPDTSVVVVPPPTWECPPTDTLWVTTIIYCHWHRTHKGNWWKHCREYCEQRKDDDDDS